MRRNLSVRFFLVDLTRLIFFEIARPALVLAVLLQLMGSGPAWSQNSDYLIDSWRNHEGVPESSVLTVAQSPDGYLWVGSPEGLLRFNGVNFVKAEQFSAMLRLQTSIDFLATDRSGRLWAGADGRLARYDHGRWHGVGSTNVFFRSVAEANDGRVFLGGMVGQLYTIKDNQVVTHPPPAGLTNSGVFCISDVKDGGFWLVNRGFIGRLTTKGWLRLGPTNAIAKSLVAAPARQGGIWVYVPGELRRFQADGTVTSFPAIDLDQPREIIEDRFGTIWVASIAAGLTHFRPGGRAVTINAANGLAHNTVRCVLEDFEGNLWAGGSVSGLNRLKPRQFLTLGRGDGLPDNAVRTVAEESPGHILVGTQGGGMARIHDGKVVVETSSSAGVPSKNIWSLLRDRGGRLWVGTYHDGLFVETNGFPRPFPLVAGWEKSVACLMEDAHGRVWAGGPTGLCVIETNSTVTSITNSVIKGFAVTSLAKDSKSHTIWIGTFAHGVYRMDKGDPSRISPLADLPGRRISSLTMDQDGFLWVGIFEHGLACVHDGITTLIGVEQGLPADTIGSLLEDGHGWFWLGSTRGILRVAVNDLHRQAQQPNLTASWSVFNTSDGMDSEYCAEGYQPTALRASQGRLWFGTDRGVVTVDPAGLRLNTNLPPVLVERVGFTDHAGTNHILLKPFADKLVIPAGSTELAFFFDALSYTAPEKVEFAYRLEGVNKNWVSLGHQRELHFRAMAPGSYELHIQAANNDGLWNETGATLAFTIKPFLWQTLWFRLLVLLAVGGGGGMAIWRTTRGRFQRRIEQLQQQRLLEQERARLATVMENTSDLVVFADHQGGVIHVNSAGRKLLGLAAGEAVHTLTLAELQPRWAATLVANQAIPAARQQGTWEGETALLHRDGHEIPVSQVIIAHKDAAGSDTFLSTIARDITEQKRAEAELQRREKHFRSLIEHASDSITVINPQAIVTYQSSSGERLLGYPAEAMLGRCLLDLVHPEDLPKAQAGLAQTVAQPDASVTVIARLRHQKGDWRTVEAVGTSLRTDAGDQQIILNSRDLTDTLKLEEQFRQAQKMEAVGRLSGGIAHDFNNILTVIQGNVDFLKAGEKLSPGEREALADITVGAERAAALTRQLLAFSRRQTMQLASLDVNQVVTQMVRMLRRILGEDIEMQLTYAAPPPFVRADAGMLEQVLLNLVVNSRDAMPKGGRLEIETTAAVFDRAMVAQDPQLREGDFACLRVTDNGCGIPPDLMTRIFEPFFTTKDVGKGTGLGLATVYGIVEQHNGWVNVTSEIGRGTTFRIYLPRHAPSEAAKPPAQKLATVDGGNETILLVEDEPSLRMLARKYLTRLGYQIIEAETGVQALKIWPRHKHEIALVVTDMVMPGGVSGRELGEQLRRDLAGLKIIYTSGYSADIAGKDFPLQEGVNFLPKPFNSADLARLVRKTIDEPATFNTLAPGAMTE